MLQENKARRKFSEKWKMFVFRKIWLALFSCNIRFELRPFTLLPVIIIKETFYLSNSITPIQELIFKVLDIF